MHMQLTVHLRSDPRRVPAMSWVSNPNTCLSVCLQERKSFGEPNWLWNNEEKLVYYLIIV